MIRKEGGQRGNRLDLGPRTGGTGGPYELGVSHHYVLGEGVNRPEGKVIR